jgi:hypothetical protein
LRDTQTHLVRALKGADYFPTQLLRIGDPSASSAGFDQLNRSADVVDVGTKHDRTTALYRFEHIMASGLRERSSDKGNRGPGIETGKFPHGIQE